MKITLKYSTVLVTALLLLSGCSKAQSSSAEDKAYGANDNSTGPKENNSDSTKNTNLIGKNVLIVYLSRTKNTKAIAEIIQKTVGGNLVSLELDKPYPENYQAIVDQVAKENASGYLPPLKTKIDSLEKYDLIFLGFPTWGMQLPPPMKSFLKQYDLKGKTIIPFNTNAGYGIGSTFQTVKEMASSSKVLEGFTTQGGKERDGIFFVMKGDKEKQAQGEVQAWLKKIGVIK